jgi:sarcosine oxidase subunit gamma
VVEFNLVPRSALAPFIQLGWYGATVDSPGVVLSEVNNFALASITAFNGQDMALSAAIKAHFKIDLPKASQTTIMNGITFISIAPSQWLAFAESSKAKDFISTLESATGTIAAVVDQSDARAIIEISGPKARETLAKGISVDLHQKAFAVGDSASTLAVQLWITLWQTELAPTYRIAVFRAFGSSLLEWLVNSGAEFGCQVIGDPIP